MDTDVIIIGTGFGGSVVAARAAAAGRRVIALERGLRLSPGDWDALAAGRESLLHGPHSRGPGEVHAYRGLGALTGSGLGGGSRIYTSVTIRAKPETFHQGWPRDWTADTLEPHYARVQARIAPSPAPDGHPRAAALERIGAALGVPVTRLPLAVHWPHKSTYVATPRDDGPPLADLVRWMQGGTTAPKRSLDQTYLADALRDGADLRTGCAAEVIEPIPGGYRVHYEHFDGDTHVAHCVTGRRVVLAAGTLNTLRLLFAQRDQHRTLPRLGPQLGRRFHTNGDRGAMLIGPDADLRPDHGPPVTAWLDHWDSDRLFIMEMGTPPAWRRPIAAVLSIFAPRAARRRAVPPYLWNFGVMGLDGVVGRLVPAIGGRLRHEFDRRRAGEFSRRVLTRLRAVAAAAGARLLAAPAWVDRFMPVTVHALGGACLADDSTSGVTDSLGEVFGHPGLFIADGSLLPTPTGVPPSMTIAALAERVADRLLAGLP